MPPIPLPVPTPGLPFSNIANVVPPPPQDPPSVDDVLLAKAYAQRALVAGELLLLLLSPSNLFAEKYPGQIDRQTTVGALVYADSILAAASGGGVSFISPPLTFSTTISRCATLLYKPINTRLDGINTRIDGIFAKIDQFFAKIDQLIISTAKNHNRTLGDGRPVAFVPVPFPDGTMPSGNNDTPTALADAATEGVVREAIGCSAVY
ncbi:hypothetical protein B0H14DRAFT_2860046 [Mycena olivaceomarginata]|nr:hypothetical protein B0H14DRAFT_2860046 [Mycena olivaceomarginata]